MRWEDERYVRIYTRDTADWLGLSFIAQGLFCLLLRKVDRAGILPLGKQGRRAVAICIGHVGDWSRLEPALDELLADGCLRIEGDHLLVPNFIEAQEAVQSDAQRKRESRARARDLAGAPQSQNVTGTSAGPDTPDKPSRDVTGCPINGQNVTSGHAASQAVTPSLAVPSLAVTEPSLSVELCDGTDRGTATDRLEEQAQTGSTELLRLTLQKRLGRQVGGCGKERATADTITRFINKFGLENTVTASLEVDEILRRKGDGLHSIAVLPKFLETVVVAP